MSAALLAVRGLTTRFHTSRGVVGAVEDVSFDVAEGEAVGIVGESGSGKSVSALSVLRLVPVPGRIVSGKVLWRGTDLLTQPDAAMRAVRRAEIAMIFQDPANFLNPIFRVGEQIADGIEASNLSRDRIQGQVLDALKDVHIADPARVARSYPFQLSGGMQQRIVIAAALVRRPSLIIADEPTTALDATVQFQILQLLAELQSGSRSAIILISHDLAVVASLCTRVYVMYAAQVIESGPVERIYQAPAHPYTRGLLGSIVDPLEKREHLTVMAGALPSLVHPPTGCRFHSRCPEAMAVCSQRDPPDVSLPDGQTVKCWLHAERRGE
ncbi:MAG: ABC transporter ATP-binding protein [Burkholderiales bacterium]